MTHLVISGELGAGKRALGKMVAAALDAQHVDLVEHVARHAEPGPEEGEASRYARIQEAGQRTIVRELDSVVMAAMEPHRGARMVWSGLRHVELLLGLRQHLRESIGLTPQYLQMIFLRTPSDLRYRRLRERGINEVQARSLSSDIAEEQVRRILPQYATHVPLNVDGGWPLDLQVQRVMQAMDQLS